MGEAKLKLEGKKEAFEKEPEMFVDVRDCLLIIRRPEQPGAPVPIMNACQTIDEVFATKGYAEESLQNRRDYIRVMQAKKKDSRIQIVNKMPPLPGSNGHLYPAKG